eukprot:TRINITY_DN11133_c0_g1_i1.p1 TRINITY_DN11133_c0_g1~~TRINITY_DN11133_c0_g1_i1.p1  ORF type:complete len:526 (+),score=125.18 TRINITY_DN11133_c0_g1_i1:106-1683(+)
MRSVKSLQGTPATGKCGISTPSCALGRPAIRTSAAAIAQATRLLQALDREQHEESLRGCFADLVAALKTSSEIAQASAAAGGIAFAASAAASACHDCPIQVYALHVIAVLAMEHKALGNKLQLSPAAAAAAAAVAAAASQRFTDAQLQQNVYKVFNALAACGGDVAQAALDAGASQVITEALTLEAKTVHPRITKSALHTARAFTEVAAVPAAEVVGVLRQSTHDPELQAAACETLSRQLSLGRPNLANHALAVGAFEAALGASEVKHLRLQVAACRLMAELVDASASDSGFQAAQHPEAAAPAAAAALRTFMELQDSVSCSKALPSQVHVEIAAQELCRSFARISRQLPAESVMGVLSSEGYLTSPRHWVAALRMAAGCAEVLKFLCEASNDMICKGSGRVLAEAGAAESLVAAMRSCPRDPGLQRAACEVLSAIASYNAERAIAAGGVQACADALRNHQAFAWVCLAALEAITAHLLRRDVTALLPVGEEEVQVCWDLASGALRRHATSQRVVKAAHTLLTLL